VNGMATLLYKNQLNGPIPSRGKAFNFKKPIYEAYKVDLLDGER
jgi:hypothetical protein